MSGLIDSMSRYFEIYRQRSSRKHAQLTREGEGFEFQDPNSSSDMDRGASKARRQVGFWRLISIIFVLVTVAELIALIWMTMNSETESSSVPTCGTRDVFQNVIDRSEPDMPGPFHDLTKHEMKKLRIFLERSADIKAVDPSKAKMSDSTIFVMDLYPAKKREVLQYLDKKGPQPPRQARVIMFRGDLNPPVLQEYICGPLPEVKNCTMLVSDKRRNPVEFSMRPIGLEEYVAIYDVLLSHVDKKIGYILKNTYGTTYTQCQPKDCFKTYPSPIGTNLTGDVNSRQLWLWADYPVEYYVEHPVDFGVQVVLPGADPSKFHTAKVWFHGKIYDSLDDLAVKYNASSVLQGYKLPKAVETPRVSSTLYQRGDPQPPHPQRPPTMVEPDGKRYSLKDRKVEYLGWSFNFRVSALTGPSLYDVRYKGERIAYEIGLAEIAVFYSADNPMHRATDFVDSGALIGTHTKSLVPGGDCPESATFINQTFNGQTTRDPVELTQALCLFENNNGYPLRRHLSYSQHEGAYYGGMLDSVLTLRSALTIVNYDYILDFIFHQNGVVETRVMSTGYILPSFYTSKEDKYGFEIEKNLIGNIHHHMFHFKADIDIHGTSNRYETLDISTETVNMKTFPDRKYNQIKYERNVKRKEKDALYKFDFDKPKYHVVHNNARKTNYNAIKAYRIAMMGMSKQLLPENENNEGAVPWARHQLVVTKHKDDEIVSSSPYAMYDSANPVTDFTKFYEDDEDILDEDLVFWITEGMHHIPHTEDLPLTPTIGNHLAFFLLPYNYFEECPSVASRDHIRISHKNKDKPKDGVKIERNGQSKSQCVLPSVAQKYDDMLEQNPDIILETKESLGIL